MITSPKESATPRWPRAFVVESTMIAPQPAKTRANVPNASAPSRRASGGIVLPGSFQRDGSSHDIAEPVECAVGQAKVGEAAAPLTLEQPRLGEQLEVVGHGGLLQAERLGEVADADRLATRPREHVEDLDAVAVGERLEERLELDRLRIREGRPRDRRAAGDEWEDFAHRPIISICIDAIEVGPAPQQQPAAVSGWITG